MAGLDPAIHVFAFGERRKTWILGSSPGMTRKDEGTMKLFWWIVLALVAVVLILFAVSNRQSVSVGLWPLPALVELPLYLVVLGTLLVGFFAGELVGWVRNWRWRREARRSRDRISLLERELDAVRAPRATSGAPVALAPR
jgi:lipopolysaccharide assembly protein A